MSITVKCTIMWAQLAVKNQLSGKYQVDLCNLSDAAAAALEATGMNVRYNPDKGHFITPKSKYEIVAKDKSGVSLEGIAIGNGSEAVAVIGQYEWKFGGKAGVNPNLEQLVITDLVEYEDNSDEAPNLDEAL